MEIREFENLIREYYGYKLTFSLMNLEKKTVEFILYDSFHLSVSIGDRYGVFGAAIGIGDMMFGLSNVLGTDISLNSDLNSISSNLATIDNYCRLRLPDKFLKAFEEAYNNN